MRQEDNRGKDVYKEIRSLPHPVSRRHPQMSMHDRAAQFAPFAALTGYEEAVAEKARLTEARMELSEDEAEILNRNLEEIRRTAGRFAAEVTYFVKDEKKEGGRYCTKTGKVKRIDGQQGILVFEDGETVRIEDLTQIEFVGLSSE